MGTACPLVGVWLRNTSGHHSYSFTKPIYVVLTVKSNFGQPLHIFVPLSVKTQIRILSILSILTWFVDVGFPPRLVPRLILHRFYSFNSKREPLRNAMLLSLFAKPFFVKPNLTLYRASHLVVDLVWLTWISIVPLSAQHSNQNLTNQGLIHLLFEESS